MPSSVLPATAQAMRQLLSQLRRKGACIERRIDDDATESWVIVQPGRTHPGRADRQTIRFHARTVAYACEHAWLVSDIPGQRLRLTEAGALVLQRGLTFDDFAVPTHSGAPVTAAPVRTRITSRSEPSASTISRLRRHRDAAGRRLISGAAAEAAERLARDFLKGQMMPRVTADWDKAAMGQRPAGMAPGLGLDLREQISDAQERVRRALDHVGGDLAGVLIDVCCLDQGLEEVERSRGWPARSGRVVLGIALDRLARHYGIVAEGPSRGKVGRWGTGDDKPTLDAWRQ